MCGRAGRRGALRADRANRGTRVAARRPKATSLTPPSPQLHAPWGWIGGR